MLRNLSSAIPILMAGGAQWFDVMLDDAIALYTADGSSGATMTEQVAARTATITGGHNYTAYSNHSGARKALRGNGEHRGTVPTAIGKSSSNFTVIWVGTLGTYSTAEALFHGYIDASNSFSIRHTAANTLNVFHDAGGTISHQITGIPENETIVIAYEMDGADANWTVCHADGTETGAKTYAHGAMTGSYTALTIGATNAGTLPILAGTNFHAVGIYNVSKTQAQVQAIYDALMGKKLGADLVDAGAGTFDSGIYSWLAYGTNSIANVGNALQITYNDNPSGAYNFLRNTSDLSTDLTLGRVYKYQVTASVNTGACNIVVYDGASYSVQAITTTPTVYEIYFGAKSVTNTFIAMNAMSAGQIVTLDNWSLQEVTYTGVITDAPLYNVSPTGDLLSQASYSARTTSIAVNELGVSDYTVEVTSNGDPVTDVTSLFFRHSVNVSEMVELRFTVAGACEVYEYDPTATLIGTITAVDGALLKFVFAGTALTAYKNGATTASLAVTLAAEAEYGTKYYATVAGTHNFDMTVYDTYTQRFANDIQALSYLNADMYFKNGSLTERLGTGRDLSPNEVRLVEGDRFLFSESDSSLLQTYVAELNTDTGSWIFEGNAYRLGGNSTGKFFKQLSSNDVLELASTTGLNYEVNYVTTDLQAKLTSGGIVLGDNTLVIASMNEATDTAELYTNATANTLSTDTAGVGGRTTGTGNYIYGNDLATSGNDAWYGTFKRMAKLHQLATESLNDMIQAEMVIKDYYANLNSLVSPTVGIVTNPDGTFYDDVLNTAIATTGTLGTVRGAKGQYGVIGYADIASFLPVSLSSLSAVFDVELDLTDAVNSILYIQNDSTDFIHLYTSTTALVLSYDDGSAHNASYTLSGLSLGDGDLCQIAIKIDSDGLKLSINGQLVASDATAFVAFTGYTANVTAIGAANSSSGTTSYDKNIYTAYISVNQTIDQLTALRASNLITANGATWYKHLSDTYTLAKLNNSYGNNLMSSGGAADTLSSATVSALFAPNGQQYIDFTSAGHLNIGLTSLSMNDKRYSFYVQPATNTVSTTLCQAFLIYVDADNYISGYFGTTASQLIVDYRAAGATNQMTFDTAAATVNYLVEIDIPTSGGTAELFINGTSTDTVVLTNDIVGAALSDGNTVVGALNTSNTSHLQGYATNLQITSIPADGLSDYTDAVGTVLS